MNSTEYVSQIRNTFSAHVDPVAVTQRYTVLTSLVRGSNIAQVDSCWLDFPIVQPTLSYDTVLVTDEFLTYAADVEKQQQLIQQTVTQAKQRLIITTRDFKNHNWNQHQPVIIYTSQDKLIRIDQVTGNAIDRQCWSQHTYLIHHKKDGQINTYHTGPVARRAVFFKQLAKFCFDAGCKDFQVLDQVLYKPLLQNHVEHVIVVDF